jgi:Flp pilus assembly protein TadG
MVSVELAAALPVLVLLMLAGLSAIRVVDARVRCLDAAREIARAAARGDDQAVRDGRAEAPTGASVSVASSADEIRVTVAVLVHPLGPDLPAVTVRESAVAATEPTTASASRHGRAPPPTQ